MLNISKLFEALVIVLKKLGSINMIDFTFILTILILLIVLPIFLFIFKKRTNIQSDVEKQKNILKSLLFSMQEGVLITDLDGNISEINLTFMDIFNLDPHTDYNNKPVGVVLQIPEIEKIINKILHEKCGLIEEEIRLVDKKKLNIKASQFVTNENQLIGVLLVVNDITLIKELEGMRRTFAANVSHELRTPLTSIQGYVETLLDGKVTDEKMQKSFLQIVYNQAVRLRNIVDDLMSLSKIENMSESGDLEMIRGEIEAVIKSAVLQCQEKANNKKINISIFMNGKIYVKMNTRLLEQAIYNLLDNAIKFSSEESQVKIQVEGVGNEVSLVVSDNGAGILKKHHQRIFERFYMVDKARSRELGGSGLGLSIVKHIVQIHKGRVDVKSEVGKGSAFYVYLPLN